MSLDYELRIATEWEPTPMLNMLAKKLELQWGEYPRLFNSGLILGVYEEEEKIPNFTLKHFGFIPTIDVWFRLKKNENYQLGKQTLLQASTLLLSHIPGDAILLFNYDRIVLQRIDNQLVFNKELGIWQADELAEVPLPYDLRPLPSPLLN